MNQEAIQNALRKSIRKSMGGHVIMRKTLKEQQMAEVQYLRRKSLKLHASGDSVELAKKQLSSQKNKSLREIRKKMGKIVDSIPVLVFMTVLTIYALFFDDIRMACFGKESDSGFYVVELLS